jgi:hypothetical protein
LKGLGDTTIYQLGKATFKIEPTIEVKETEHAALKSRLSETERESETLKLDNKALREKNENLQKEIRRLGSTPSPSDAVTLPVDAENEAAWSLIDSDLRALNTLVSSAPVPSAQYARFLFLYQDDSGQKYNSYERTFDECIEEKLVTRSGDGYYALNPDHRLNKKAMKIMDRLESRLKDYGKRFRSDEDDGDDYEYSLTDPTFWSERVGFNVR